ncbi:M20 family metallopeptidase [Clostridium estertheticum]|uniref:M20 family metallopeptidase n=1 Tax=Clostridium estertheticum TaxID=238834 RepID=UPI001CF416F3|nr:M20/M25/M40 family metallo-hydrolase [Clostridium estertheticum]MCB2354872.1 M20/M25/M40 family metallo-hydrolase [Clostridium estertheticum]WAG41112.1 M20/M25/M40 family metallo-hydrolase [Clostridium estertheticum]
MKEIDLLKNLIRYNSCTIEKSNELLIYCKEWLLENNLSCEIFENNGCKFLTSSIGSGGKTLVFNGHLDVVSGGEEQFSPYIEGDKLFGRGSSDMKAGVCAMMIAMSELRDEDLSCRVMLQLVTDEETGGENCSKFLSTNKFLGDFILCGEPTQLNIGVQAKGILQLDLEFHGVSAHGSRPWQGINAISSAYESFNKIKNLPFTKESTELYEGPSINLAKIAGGEVYNKVPDYCKMSLDIRFLPTQSAEEIINQIKKVVDCNILIHATGDPVKTNINDRSVLLLREITLKHTKSQCKLFGQHGSSDTRFFSKYNIPAVEFGPCGEKWHGDGEYVLISSVIKYKEILVDFAKNF